MMKAAIGVVALALLLTSGCLLPERTVVDVTYYSVEPAAPAPPERTPADLALAVRALDSASRYQPTILYRDEGHVVAYLEGERWVEPPAEMVTRALRRALDAGRIARVVAAERLVRRPDVVVEGSLTRFDQVRGKTAWTAECELELVVKDAVSSQVLLARRLAVARPAEARTTAAFVAAMNAAVADLIAQAADAVAEGLAARGKKGA
jgi:ABC-type uncharacterized transport system auxiliary subunit